MLGRSPLVPALAPHRRQWYRYVDTYLEHGYDDLRVATCMSDEDLKEIHIPADDRLVLLTAGLDWQSRAQATGLLERWAVEMHRAGETKVFNTTRAKDKVPEKGRRGGSMVKPDKPAGVAIAEAAAVTERLAAQGDSSTAEGTRDPSDVVDTSGHTSIDWDPTPILKVLYDDPRPEHEDGVEVEAQKEKAVVAMEGFLEKLPKVCAVVRGVFWWTLRVRGMKTRRLSCGCFPSGRRAHPLCRYRKRG